MDEIKTGSQPTFSHIDEKNDPGMVDVSGKTPTARTATAMSRIKLNQDIMKAFEQGDIRTKKGAVFQTAIIAGTIAVKKTSDLIPLCHSLPIEKCDFEFKRAPEHVEIYCTVKTSAKTGVEMEALTGVSVAALTVYDMCKAVSHDIIIEETKLLMKTGGKSDFISGK